MELPSIGTMNCEIGLGTTQLYRLQLLRHLLPLSAPRSQQPLLAGIICMFFPSPSYKRRLRHVLLFYVLTVNAHLHSSASRSKLTSSLVSLLARVSFSVRHWATTHDMLHRTLPTLLFSSFLYHLQRPVRSATTFSDCTRWQGTAMAILARHLGEVQNCLIVLTSTCSPPTCPSHHRYLKKRPLYVIALFSIPGTLISPYLLILLTSSLSSFFSY